MKTITRLTLLAVFFAFVACSSDDDNRSASGKDILAVSKTEVISDSHNGFKDSIGVNTDLSWEITKDQEWVSVSPTSGSGDAEIVVTVDANNTDEVREATIMVITEQKKRMISVIQPNDESMLTFNVSPSEIVAESFEAYTDSIQIETGLTWEVTNEISWIHLSASSGKGETNLKVSLGENNGPEAREAVLNFTSKLGEQEVRITQPGNEGMALFVDPELIEKETFEAFVDSVEIKTTTSWTIENTADWISVSEEEGEGDLSIAITGEENAGDTREALIKIITDFEEKEIRIVQPGNDTPEIADVLELTGTPEVGGVFLAWEVSSHKYTYLEVKYLKNNVEVIEKVNPSQNSMLIEGLIHKEPTSFEVRAITEIDGVAEAGESKSTDPITPIARALQEGDLDPNDLTQITLTSDMLEGHTQEATEGPIEDLVDGDAGTYWHSAWSAGVEPLPHWIQIAFGELQKIGAIKYMHRAHAGNKDGRPSQFALDVSDDGDNWDRVWISEDRLDIDEDNNFKEHTLLLDQNYESKYFRVVILKNDSMSHPEKYNGEATFVALAELSVYTAGESSGRDLEAEAEEEYYNFQG